ncbi:MAG TPA: hypothetical protein VKT25_14570 [Ktedonobacteraceae bacterium]|nr:hypothetical protein [Ktedonobacteraceae bacterium]
MFPAQARIGDLVDAEIDADQPGSEDGDAQPRRKDDFFDLNIEQ